MSLQTFIKECKLTTKVSNYLFFFLTEEKKTHKHGSHMHILTHTFSNQMKPIYVYWKRLSMFTFPYAIVLMINKRTLMCANSFPYILTKFILV